MISEMTSPIHAHLEKTMLFPRERRQRTVWGKIKRELWSWFFESELKTMRIGLTIFCVALAIGIAFFSHLVDNFPPIWQRNSFTPPYQFWIIWLLFGVLWQGKSWDNTCKDECRSRNGSTFLFFVLLLMVAPLSHRTPILSSIVAVAAIGQGTLSARVIHKCRMINRKT